MTANEAIERAASAELVSVVLPVFNEHENIAVCLRGLWRALAGCEHEILVCYDFDEDTTLGAIASMPDRPPSVRLVKNTLGRGAPNAIRAGFQAARGDVIVTSMADLSDPPEVILAMAEKIRREGADVVAGSRYAPGGSQTGGPLLKRVMSECAGRSLAWIAGVRTSDATSNFRAYSRRFLERATIESRAGFEIALELTVKAHLAGAKVDEVPSSWVDRTAGKSRFRLWKWLPNYLRWYLRAALEPIAVWALWAVLALVFARKLHAAGFATPNDAFVAAALAGCAAAAILCARALRGRTTYFDALQAWLWLHAWHVEPWTSGAAARDVALTAVASAVALFATTPARAARARLARVGAALREHVDARSLGWLLVTALVWASHVSMPRRASGPELDTSWAQALGYALRHGFRFGSEFAFTYGPLGYFNVAPYDAQLFWSKVVVWEIALKLVLAAFIVRAIARIPSTLERVLCVLALLLLNPEFDPFFFLSILALAAALVEGGASRPRQSALAVACLALLSLVKFTYCLLAVLVVVVACAARWRERSRRAALGLAASFTVVLLLAWCACDQSPLDLPAYFATSLAIAGAYNEAMSAEGPWIETQLACVALASSGVLVLANSWLARRSVAHHLLGLLWIAGAYLAFKAGFVRHMRTSVTFFAVAAVAPYLLPPACARAADGVVRAAARTVADSVAELLRPVARSVCLVACAMGYVLAMNFEKNPIERLGRQLTGNLQSELGALADVRAFRAMREAELAQLRKVHALPRVRARVGDESIDALGSSQGILFLNDFVWSPRPVFQSYVAYTEDLAGRNARYFESERAPRFVLFRPESIDQRWPAQEDWPAMEVVLSRYAAVMSEGGYLLLQRRGTPRPARAERAVVLERTIAFGDRVDLAGVYASRDPASAPSSHGSDSGVAPLPRAHVLAVDLSYSALGRVWKTLAKSPAVTLEAELSDGITDGYRIIPGMIRSGALIDPYLDTQDRWIQWLLGTTELRLAAFRIRVPAGDEWMFDPEIRVRVLDASDVAPDRDEARRAGLEYAMFATLPKSVSTPLPAYRSTFLNDEVLVVHAPAELRFDVTPGEHRLTATFGIHPDAFERGGTDGLGFQAVLVERDGAERVLFERALDPMRVRPDRRRQPLDVTFRAERPSEIVLRTLPGPAGDGANDLAFWTGVEIAPR